MKILLLTSRFPYPIEKGDKLRIYHQIRLLSRDHRIILFCLSDLPVPDPDYQQIARYCEQIYLFRLRKPGIYMALLKALFQQIPFQTAYFFRPFLKRKLHKIIQKEQPELIYCQLIRMAPYTKGLHGTKTLDYMDAFSAGMLRRAKEENGLKKWLFHQEALRVSTYERKIYPEFDHHTIISLPDRTCLSLDKAQHITVVPNGVDTEFFSPQQNAIPKYEIFFVGNMQYFPNITAVKYLVRRIMPLIWKQYPTLKVMLAGAQPDPEVLELKHDGKVYVTGWLDDIRDAYHNGQIFVAPLFTGSGQQNKILEAMSMQRAVITTSMVNEAIKASAGSEVLLAERPEAFADHISHLLENPGNLKSLGKKAREFVRQHYSWESSVRKLEALFMT